MENQTKRIGLFLIHGLLGSPREYDVLTAFMESHGYVVHAPSLPGHGQLRHKPLHQVSLEEVLNHCLSAYREFARQCDQVVVMGHSLGGICTLLTAAEQPEKLSAIIVFSAPYEHAYNVNRTMDLLTLPPDVLYSALTYVPDHHTGFERPWFYPWKLNHLLEEGNRVLGRLQQRIDRIEVPVLLGHSPYDLIIPYGEMGKLSKNLTRSRLVETHTFEACGHQIFPHTRESENAQYAILRFLTHSCDLSPRRL